MNNILRNKSGKYASLIADQTVLIGKPILPEDICIAYCDGYQAAKSEKFECKNFEDAWLRLEVEDYRGIGKGKTTIANIAVTSKRKAAELLWQAACEFKDAEIKELAKVVVELARGGYSIRQKDTIEKAKRIIGSEL